MTWQDPRYAGDDIDWTALQQARAEVADRFAVMFRDRPYMEQGYTVGGMSDIEFNGMPTLETSPRESPAWRRMIDKAKRDIAERQSEIRVREMARAISQEELANDINEIKQWADSLRKTASVSGSIALTRRGMN